MYDFCSSITVIWFPSLKRDIVVIEDAASKIGMSLNTK